MVSTKIQEKIKQIVNEIVSEKKLLHIDTIVRGTDKNVVIEVFIDSKEGVDTDICEVISNLIKEKIEIDLELDNYRLDVSSPGIDRPLIYLDQYYKHIGRKFDLEYEIDEKKFEAKNIELFSIENEQLIFKNNKTELKLHFNQIKKAITIISF